MDITCISDLHGFYPQLEGGDLLIVAGDLTARDLPNERVVFLQWLADQDYKKKVFIGGNHDNSLVGMSFKKTRQDGVDYLCDSGTEFQYEEPSSKEWGSREGPMGIVPYEKKKLKIWGSPWTLRFPRMNPNCMAFTCETEEELAEKWALIPDDVDILVTHGPPLCILDEVEDYPSGQILSVGSFSLMQAIVRIQPKLCVFGHIHGSYGIATAKTNQSIQNICPNTIFVNACHVNERYEPVNKPIRIEL